MVDPANFVVGDLVLRVGSRRHEAARLEPEAAVAAHCLFRDSTIRRKMDDLIKQFGVA